MSGSACAIVSDHDRMTGLSALPGASRVPSIARIVASQEGTVSGMPHLFGIAGTDTQTTVTDAAKSSRSHAFAPAAVPRVCGTVIPHRHLPLQSTRMLIQLMRA